MANQSYDAIVVGSGISGGWAAKELTEKGLKVLLLERGPMVEHVKDYKTATLSPWEVPHRGRRTIELLENHPNLRRDYVLNELNLDWWAHEADSPYVEKKPFTWFRGYQVGGRSLLWGRQSYRWADEDFEANLKQGIAVDWPIRYKDLAPWYSYVEKFAGIAGNKDNLPILPDGDFMPPFPLNCVEDQVAARIKEKFNGKRAMVHARVANITQPLPGRPGCQYRNKCSLGCPFGGYFSTQSSTLPAALATGNLTLRPWSIVNKLIYDKDSKRATGVEIVDGETNEVIEFDAKIIFLCASALNSAAILMRSATEVWPEGLGSSSGELGHNVMDHHFRLGANGLVDGFDDKYYYGRRPGGFYIPRYRNLGGEKRDYVRGFGYQGGASRSGWSRNVAEIQFGAPLKNELTEPGPWSIGMTAFGEILPYHENTVKLSKTEKDKWGMYVLEMDAEIKENEKKMRVDMMNDAAEMLEAAGVKNINTYDNGYTFGQGIHEMGTARMGRDPKTSVLNGNNQVWDAKNVFVTDGAAMTSAAAQNPSLTYMAMTARAANFAVEELKKRNL
ncbi:Glucose-methanol-choline (GMC) oxidoreductase:NAD binding site [Lunatimonas lonarensis]|uniref:Glucose-methanol-choline (GMC) oxidoreductase:NAD binding site n=1 Tax=Lunatimonas lonarensis TaxID=1232681 RepID=R7ZNV5_9BACT|nr:GMC family oxidoreductase [Lunatimonas lonarensis]EON75738.1 Glucose-methanol-choline (GMC) oxidoreductase:NAD binding site [Lunatimonas lonarensis]